MDLLERMKERASKNRFAHYVGIRLVEVKTGYARIEKTVTENDLNPYDAAHGGIYLTMADNVGGYAVSSHGIPIVTAGCSYQFYRSAKLGDVLTAEAHELKHGKTLSTYDIRITDQNGVLLGSGTYTYCAIPEPNHT